jgi:hypothetical protein
MADNKVNNDLETYLTTLLTAEVTQLPTDGWIAMAHWWNCNDRERPKHS